MVAVTLHSHFASHSLIFSLSFHLPIHSFLPSTLISPPHSLSFSLSFLPPSHQSFQQAHFLPFSGKLIPNSTVTPTKVTAAHQTKMRMTRTPTKKLLEHILLASVAGTHRYHGPHLLPVSKFWNPSHMAL